jgi:hypothetical protein
LFRKFRLAHDLDHADYLLQSCILADQEIDRLLALAEAVLGPGDV